MSFTLLPKWKEEPLSPLNTDEATWNSSSSIEDAFYQTSPQQQFYADDEDVNNVKFKHELSYCESKAEVASNLLENLENLIDLDELIKDESYLLDEKILPMLDDVDQSGQFYQFAPPSPISTTKNEFLQSTTSNQQQETQYLLKEFENVYDVIEFTHETLTPPQSPPSASTSNAIKPILANLEPVLSPTTTHYAPPQPITYEYPSLATPQHDIAHELAVVDELVRTRVENMQWSTASTSSISSSSSSSSSGPCSPNLTDETSSSSVSSCSDPEWMPETIDIENRQSDDSLIIKTSNNNKKRSKPYSRCPPGDKKSRKKEQNKNAATRYRMKKKAEVEVILTEEKELQDFNQSLDNKINDMQREIKYLKGLMRDLFKAKGLIN